MELNPNHPVTQTLRSEWHKIAAIILHKLGHTELDISAQDIEAFAASRNRTIAAQSLNDTLRIRLVDDEEARRLVKKEGGQPV